MAVERERLPGPRARRLTFENYAAALYRLREDHVELRQARLGERLGVPRRAVSETIANMRAAGLVTGERDLELTPEGALLAERVVRRHRIAELFLAAMLGLGWGDVSSEADQWEHVLTDTTEHAIVRALGEPATCPHGNAIPGLAYDPPEATALDELPVGASGTIVRVSEAIETSPSTLAYFEHAHLAPGVNATLIERAPDGSVAVVAAGRTSVLSPSLAAGVFVHTDAEGDDRA